MKYETIRKDKIKKYLEDIKENITFLERHNKNYTKLQYYSILNIQEIIEELEKEMED